jgi:hypothetical protein
LKNIIEFINTGSVLDEYGPVPASNIIPNWYKDTDSYTNKTKQPDGSGNTTATIKKCMPVFDSITAGYLLLSPADIFISIKNGERIYEWSSYNLLQFHPLVQAPSHPDGMNDQYPKWVNYWGIKTPSGYSCLFMPPVHRDSVFSILPGIVDTDKYHVPVNFPFVLKNPEWTGLIPAGTPIAQVIPFKRDTWKMNASDKNIEVVRKQSWDLSTKFFDKYKNMFWNKKEFK